MKRSGGQQLGYKRCLENVVVNMETLFVEVGLWVDLNGCDDERWWILDETRGHRVTKPAVAVSCNDASRAGRDGAGQEEAV
jgi:hypothetical protein